VEAFPVPATTGTAAAELDRVCRENELVIEAWSPIHLRAVLREYYWKPDRPAVAAKVCWEDSQRYLYLPRLRSREVLAAAVRAGTASRDFFGTALGCEGGKLEGFQFGVPVAFDDGLWLVEPAEAARRAAAQQAAAAAEAAAALGVAEAGPGPSGTGSLVASPAAAGAGAAATAGGGVGGVRAAPARSFRGVAEVPAALGKSPLKTLAEEVIALLASDPYATVRVTVEIDAAFPQGVTDALRRSVSENATSLGLKTRDWEA
jgi:hypothetical protein